MIREELRDYIELQRSLNNIPYHVYSALIDGIDTLEQEPRWIPVSERLPKVADCYAVTRKIGSDLITSTCFFDGTNTWHNDNRINYERNYLTNVIAWMPLPEPYVPQESEDKE